MQQRHPLCALHGLVLCFQGLGGDSEPEDADDDGWLSDPESAVLEAREKLSESANSCDSASWQKFEPKIAHCWSRVWGVISLFL